MGKLVPFRIRGGGEKAPGDPSNPATRRFHVKIRLGVGAPSDARPSRHVVSDARRSEEVREAAGPDPDLERRRRRRKRVRSLLLVAVFVGGCIAALVGDRGYLDGRRAQRELREITSQVKEQEQKVAELKLETERVRSDPSALERVAREQLGLARPGEVVVLFADGEEGREEPFPRDTKRAASSRRQEPAPPQEEKSP